jgi:carbon monoxide dehydrogenase subunit G
MTVRVERAVTVPATPEEVWAFIADPAKRAEPISVVQDFEVREDGSAVWHLSLPIPLLDRTVAVETVDTVRNPPHRVKFEGRSSVMHVRGEHELEAVDGGTRLANRFAVDGRLPGVERFFRNRMDDELDNLEAALARELGVEL